MRKIAVITSKGGTGKTTTSINFGHAAAMMGKRTLMVDCDAQGSLSLAFGLNGVQGLSDLLLTDRVDIYNVRQNLFLVGSGKSDIYLVERYLVQQADLDYPLARALDRFTGVDIAILDCSPSINIVNSNVLNYVDSVLIPVSMDYFAMEGVALTLKIVDEIVNDSKRSIQILGILPTFFDSRTKISKTILGEVKEKYGDKVFESMIRINTQIKESQLYHKTIFEYAPYSYGAYDYYRFAKEALQKLSG
jgi:chromosome partitioning protein